MSGELARENSIRNPSRTASTAAALMIGLALVTVVAVLVAALHSTEGAVRDEVAADYVAASQNGFDPFPAAVGDAVASTPGVGSASSVRYDQALADGATEANVTGVDPPTIAPYTFDWTQTDATLGELGTDGAIVTEPFAEDRSLAVGDRFPVATARARPSTWSSGGSTTCPSSQRCWASSRSAGRPRRELPAAAEHLHLRQPGAATELVPPRAGSSKPSPASRTRNSTPSPGSSRADEGLPGPSSTSSTCCWPSRWS